MRHDEPTDDDLRRLRLRLIVDQSHQYLARELPLPDLAAGTDSLICALQEEDGDDESVAVLRPIWGSIEIINALCLDERRDPTPGEAVELRQAVIRIGDAAEARLRASD